MLMLFEVILRLALRLCVVYQRGSEAELSTTKSVGMWQLQV
jgi:hypothetical protein